MNCRFLVTLFALLAASTALARPADPKFDAIKAKRDRGEPITAEERAYAQGVMARRNQQDAAQRNRDYAAKNPPRASTGLVPLPDLAAGKYHGEPGGLYPDGRNTPPAAHAAAGLQLARSVLPLDADGRPAADGKIVLLTCGMSNTTQESQAFLKLARADAALHPRLVIVDGAQGGQTAAITAKPDANYWTVTADRLRAAGVTAQQVQVVWLKQANAGPTRPFPAEARKLQADLLATLHNLHARFPNLKLAYLSSRTYGGYASTPLNPEPHAYETAFAVQWLIADQIAGSPELNFDSARSAVRAPWLAWGAYLWTDGTKGRADGFVWAREDCGPDGTHPSESGRRKVGELLLAFLKNEPTAKPWFLRPAP
ncbi:MAG: hypothetical protein HZA93_19640 [Verrucomicrobia bacterium]|nr:hypothetical protein [Verrucomicrobiota bacterium]